MRRYKIRSVRLIENNSMAGFAIETRIGSTAFLFSKVGDHGLTTRMIHKFQRTFHHMLDDIQDDMGITLDSLPGRYAYLPFGD